MKTDNAELSKALVQAGMELLDILKELREMHEHLPTVEPAPQDVTRLREQAQGLSRQAGALRVAVGRMRPRLSA